MGKALTAADAAALKRCLAAGGVALFPADTIYGLACDPENERAVRKLYGLKGRAAARPAAVMFFELASALATLPDLAPRTRAAVERLLPGPVTLVLANPRRRFPLACGPESGKLGLRVPRLPGLAAALCAVHRPLLQSSANRSGEPAAGRIEAVPDEIVAGADLVLDAGPLPGIASTVVDLGSYESSGSYRILREGALSTEQVERALRPTLTE